MNLEASSAVSERPAITPEAVTPKPAFQQGAAAFRLDHVDLLKGLAIIGVVLHHVGVRSLGPEVALHVQGLVGAFTWAVYAFIFLAGYLHGRSNKTTSAWEFLGQRARRLLVPYLVIGVTYALLRELTMASGKVNFVSEKPRSFWKVIEALLTVDLGGIVGQQLYFYPLLFLISCLFLALWPVARTLRGAVFVAGVLFLLLAGIAITGEGYLSTTGVSRTMILAGLFQYALGHLFGRSESAVNAWRYVLAAMTVIGLLNLVLTGRQALLVLAMPLLLMLAFQRLALCRTSGLRPLRELGQASSVIFAYHSPFVLMSLIWLMQRLHFPPHPNVSITFMGTLFICWFIWWIAGRVASLRFLRV